MKVFGMRKFCNSSAIKDRHNASPDSDAKQAEYRGLNCYKISPAKHQPQYLVFL